MKSGILSLVASLMMAGPAFGAKKFWEKVPDQEWSREQASRILTKSPWARQFHISRAKLEKSYLKVGKRTRWLPTGAKLGKQQRWAALYLLFPRDGIRPVDPGDKTIEVVTRISDQKISRKFKLKDMVLEGKLAF